jgi:hypothetical protein
MNQKLIKLRKEWGEFLLIIAIIVVIGLFCFNLYLAYIYKAEFLLTPCQLCEKVNPHLKECFEEKSTIKTTPFQNDTFKINMSLYPS